MLPAIEREGAVVEKSYLRVFIRACLSGPETLARNEAQLGRQGVPLRTPVPTPGLSPINASRTH